MTTTVTVTTGTDHAANVTIRTVAQDQSVSDRVEKVEPSSNAQFHVYDGIQLLVVEEHAPVVQDEQLMNTGGSARLVTDEDIAKTNHQAD